ncbi:hypothetical protein [Tessaracoccus sp.]
MKDTLYIDLETYCLLDIRKTNPYRYSESASFEILMAGYALNDEEVRVPTDLDEIRALAPLVRDRKIRKVAHNATFDRVCLSTQIRPTNGAAYLHPADWHDTASVAMSQGYPAKLEVLARVMLPEGTQKDTAGTRLVNLFSKPNRGRRIMPSERPQEWADFRRYCGTDVEVLRELDGRLGGFQTRAERDLYTVDQLINDRGIRADLELARRAVAAGMDNKGAALVRLAEITGLDNPNSREQLYAWLHRAGLKIPDLTAETIEEELEDESLDPQLREVLELRQITALAAAAKYQAIVNGVGRDRRLRGQFRFLGAHTGRWSGRGVQLQNLPRATLEAEALEAAGLTPERGKELEEEQLQRVTDAYTRAVLLDLSMGLGATPAQLKALIRPMLLGPLAVADYSAIEAVVLAWLAGEEWALEAFRAGRNIYLETAKRMGPQYTRQQGKVTVLALGYQGAVGSLRVMGAKGTDAELRRLVDQWRAANPAIVRLWRDMERVFRTGGKAGRLEVFKDGADRRVYLPSGRWLVYKDVRFTTVETQYGPKTRASFWDYRKGHAGARIQTYGGRLTENVTQAVARDVLAESLVRLERAGFRVVGHVHDEALVETNPESLPEVEVIMCQPPSWGQDLPISAHGFVTDRYRKG